MGCRIAEVPPRDRPRERLARLGTESLTDAELVALVLRSGGRGVSALGLGEDLLAEAGGVGGLTKATLEDLAKARAMGSAKASSLVAALELGRRAASAEGPPRALIRDAGDAAAIARRELSDGSREAVVVLVLNGANRLIKTQRLTVGTDARCLLESRDVLRAVLAAGGSGFALVHNHPSGDPKPSAEDLASTERIEAAAAAAGLRFLDHVVLGGSTWCRVPSGSDRPRASQEWSCKHGDERKNVQDIIGFNRDRGVRLVPSGPPLPEQPITF